MDRAKKGECSGGIKVTAWMRMQSMYIRAKKHVGL
jgi:hypothetical protein